MGYRTGETREPLVSTRGAEARESPRYPAWRAGGGGGDAASGRDGGPVGGETWPQR